MFRGHEKFDEEQVYEFLDKQGFNYKSKNFKGKFTFFVIEDRKDAQDAYTHFTDTQRSLHSCQALVYLQRSFEEFEKIAEEMYDSSNPPQPQLKKFQSEGGRGRGNRGGRGGRGRGGYEDRGGERGGRGRGGRGGSRGGNGNFWGQTGEE